jgi:integrase
LIEAMRDTRRFALLVVLLGMRRGKIAALRWRSVDLEAGQIAVIESAEQMNGAVRFKPPKSGRARTVAPAQTIVGRLGTAGR